MGDPLGSFPRERASEDKARWKDSCWYVGTVSQIWDVTINLFEKWGNDEIWQVYSRGFICLQIETCVNQALVHQQRQIHPRLAKRASKQVFYEFRSHGESWRGEINDVQLSLIEPVDRLLVGRQPLCLGVAHCSTSYSSSSRVCDTILAFKMHFRVPFAF